MLNKKSLHYFEKCIICNTKLSCLYGEEDGSITTICDNCNITTINRIDTSLIICKNCKDNYYTPDFIKVYIKYFKFKCTKCFHEIEIGRINYVK